MPRKKFDREAAEKVWARYTEKLLAGIQETESEGLKNGLSSFEIERLWQRKAEQHKKETEEQSAHRED